MTHQELEPITPPAGEHEPTCPATGELPRPLWGLATALAVETGARTIVVPDAEVLASVVDWLEALAPTRRVIAVPGWDIAPLDHAVPDPRICARAIAAVAAWNPETDILVAEAAALAQPWIDLRDLGEAALLLEPGVSLTEALLHHRGYRRVREVSAPGEFAVRGEVIDLWSPLEPHPVRIDRFDTEVESLRRFDPLSQLGGRPVEGYRLGWSAPPPWDEAALATLERHARRRAERLGLSLETAAELRDALAAGEPVPGAVRWRARTLPRRQPPEDWEVVVAPPLVARRLQELQTAYARELSALRGAGRLHPYVELPTAPRPTRMAVAAPAKRSWRIVAEPSPTPTADLASWLRTLAAGDPRVRVWLAAPGRLGERLEELVRREGLAERLRIVPIRMRGSWWLVDQRLRIVDLATLEHRPTVRGRRRLRGLDLGDVDLGDLVVHRDYGIGEFAGLERLEVDGVPTDVVVLRYRGGDRLFVPVTRLDLLEPYRSGDEERPELDRLGSDAWQRRRAKAKEEFLRIAAELLELYAARRAARRPPLEPPGELSAAVATTFPYEATPDQERTLAEIEDDLAMETPMDRLVVGDVGFGKTEIALRTIVRFVENGYQAALLVPTTVLAAQHARTFSERLRELPIKVALLSRFVTRAQEREILAGLRSGDIDVVIGTHRLLQPDVTFANLGLVVIDEEHRFGVRHKEALKRIRREVDTLCLSATPIPRTLQLHLGGLRPISVIATPPPNRLAVETHVAPADPELVREALVRELARGGQAFVLHNRIEALDRIAVWLNELVPELRIAVVHGKLPPRRIEAAFRSFLEGEVDVLVATTIIESGLDFPRANTLVVLDAHRYGLAELYQLRGRVGRSHRRAFAYLLYPPEEALSERAAERLEVLRSFSQLGAGFQIALRDLEIRGAGELLGKRQAGHLRSVGLGTAMRLLDEAVHEVSGEPTPPAIEPEIRGDFPLFIDAEWIPEVDERLRAYQRLGSAVDERAFAEELTALVDRYGEPEPERTPFVAVARLLPSLRALAVRQLRFHGRRAILVIDPSTPLEPARLLPWLADRPHLRLANDRIHVELAHDGLERAAELGDLLSELLRVAAA